MDEKREKMTCFERLLLNRFLRGIDKVNDVHKKEIMAQLIKNKQVVICFITRKFIKDKNRKIQCDVAEENKKIMYAVVRKGTWWHRYKKYPWRQIYYFKEKAEIPKIMVDIYMDLDIMDKSGGV
jgi:hypothetical protein